jgi:4-oxalocrotonate tautomerase
MPLVTIQLLEGRNEEKIKEVIKNVTYVISETLDAPKESVRVLVSELPKTHWGVGGIPVSDRPKRN